MNADSRNGDIITYHISCAYTEMSDIGLNWSQTGHTAIAKHSTQPEPNGCGYVEACDVTAPVREHDNGYNKRAVHGNSDPQTGDGFES